MTKIKALNKVFINLGIILFFILVAYAYLFPLVEGKILQMPDIDHFKGMSKELIDYREKTGEEAVWTNSMFGGMPGYLISVVYSGNLARVFSFGMRNLFSIASFLILYFIGFYILLSSLKINKWLAVMGALAFGFSSYMLIIIGAGHTSKANAIGLLAPVVAGVLLAFKGKYRGGALLFAAALSLEILSGHLQITYYGFLMIGIFALVQLYYSFKEKELAKYFKAVLYLFAGAVIALGMNFSRLYTTWEFSKETIRGPSELTSNNENKTTGLDRDYIVQWSQGIDETLTLLIPNYMGGSTSTNPAVNGETYQVLRENNIQSPREVLKGVLMYHGDKPATAGPYYFGAIICFLFILGLFVVKGPKKWWLLSVTVLAILMSWGKNFMGFTNFLLDYLPMYNKFRAPEMNLIMANFAFPLLAILALHEIISEKVSKKEFQNGFLWALVTTGGLSLVFYLSPKMAGDFSAHFDSSYPEWLLPAIKADRMNLLKTDALRSFGFIVVSAALLYLGFLKKLKYNYVLIGMGILILVDLWAVDKRFLNNDAFVSKREAKDPFPLMPVDEAILNDKSLSYRVLPLNNPWQDARASYYHKNVGGYNAAKMRRFNELIDHQLTPEMNSMIQRFQKTNSLDTIFGPLSAINMLNTRYIIYDLNSPPIQNPKALGNAWFVNSYKMVANADEEIAAMKTLKSENEAVIDKRFEEYVKGKNFTKDTIGFIELTEYEPNYLKYQTKANTEQLTVFSEIYYDKGWHAYIDGEKVPYFRVNYVLRAMVLPAGEHTVEFKFEPTSYYMGNKVSLASSILLLFLIAGFAYTEYVKKNLKK